MEHAPNAAPTLASTLHPLSLRNQPGCASDWLRRFFQHQHAYLPSDDLATCFWSCSAVIMTALVLQTRNATTIGAISGFPALFVEAVMNAIIGEQLWDRETVVASAGNLRSYPEDVRGLRQDLECAMASVWDAIYSPEFYVALESRRQRTLFGGEPQWWLDEDACEYFALV